MLLREWILAALFAVAAVVFSVGAGLVWGAGVALMVGAVLLAVWSWSIVTVGADELALPADVDGPVSVAKRSDSTGAQTPAQMMASLEAPDDDDALE